MGDISKREASVADPDPGSGALLDPWIWDPELIKIKIRIRDPG